MSLLRPRFRAIPIMATLALALAAFLPSPVFAGSKKEGLRISFHVEGEESDGPNRVKAFRIGDEPRFFEIIPTITHHNFIGYYQFPAADGTFGAAFVLNERGRTALSRVAVEKRGRLILPVINSTPSDELLIDRPQGEFIVIWRGFGPEHFTYFEKKWKLRPINEPADMRGL